MPSKTKTAAKPAARKVPRKVDAKSVTVAKTTVAGLIPLKRICGELKIPANCTTRNVIRKALRAGELPKPVHAIGYGSRHAYTASQAAQVRALLRSHFAG